MVVGLTGGIGCGKSVATEIFARLGAYIIDMDVISRMILAPGGEAVRTISHEFGCVTDGTLDRAALRKVVFGDANKLARLNAITHPIMINKARQLIEEHEGINLLVAPLMFETGMDKIADIVITIEADMEVRINRIITRDNIDRELALAIIASQADDKIRVSKADYVITNDGTVEQLEKEITEWWYEHIA